MFPAASRGKDKTGHALSFPDVCKIPAPPAPVTPILYPAIHAEKLSSAKKKVILAKKELIKKGQMASSSGDEPGVLKGIVSMKTMEKLIFKHEGALKQAPKLRYRQAAKIQEVCERDIWRCVMDLERDVGKRRDLVHVVQEIKLVVGKAARGL